MADQGAIGNSFYYTNDTLRDPQSWQNIQAGPTLVPDSKWRGEGGGTTRSTTVRSLFPQIWNNIQVAQIPDPRSATTASARPFPYYLATNVDFTRFVPTGSISGVAKISGTPVANVKVGLYYRPSMEIIGITWTNALGVYTFTGLDTGAITAGQYFELFLDPTNTYNAARLDRLTPS